MWAVSKEHTEVALYLIAFGAKLRIQDFDGRSAVRSRDRGAVWSRERGKSQEWTGEKGEKGGRQRGTHVICLIE